MVSAFITERPLWSSLVQGDWVFAGFELMLWVLAGLHVWLALRTGRHQPRERKANKRQAESLTGEDAMPPGAAIAEEGAR